MQPISVFRIGFPDSRKSAVRRRKYWIVLDTEPAAKWEDGDGAIIESAAVPPLICQTTLSHIASQGLADGLRNRPQVQMEFFFAVFFLLFYYLRPQDWVPGFIGLNIVKPIIAIWLGALFAGRSLPSPLPGVLRTPHDWLILSYFVYVVWNAPDSTETFKGFLPLVAFFALTVQSLNSWTRLQTYLKWWTIALAVLALLGVLIPLGIDPTGGKDYTMQFGRLALGTWLHDNPNALGHSVIVAVPASYFVFFWRGNAFGRWVVFPIITAIACWCVYLTESKGSFLVGGALVASIFIVGRPRIVQIAALATAMVLGVGALSFLPRMSQMSDLSAEQGVQGRLMTWEVARTESKLHATGAGWKQFVALIDVKGWDGEMIYDMPKATHSSYVQIAADLGRYGLFFYLAGFWCVFRTLLKFRPADETEDRCRRVLWVLLISTLISGWMINREYHTEYFLLVAAAGALHRLAKGRELELLNAASSEVPKSESPETQSPELIPSSEPVREIGSSALSISDSTVKEGLPAKPLWNRFGLLDFGACIGLTWLTFWVWDYILENI